MLKEQFEKVKKDVMRFVFKNEDLFYYTKDLFFQMVDKISE